MGATKRMFFSGDTEAQAVLAAANHFGVSPEQVVFDRMEKRHGFVRRRRLVIRVDSTRTVGPTPEPTSGPEPRPVVATDAASEPVAEAVDQPIVEPGEAQVEAQEQSAAAGGEAVADRDPEPPEEAPEQEAAQTTLPSEGAQMPEMHEDAMPRDGSTAESEPETPSGADDDEIVLEVATASLRRLLELADIDVSMEIVRTRERLDVEIEGVDDEVLTEQDGQVLLALQHLLPRVMYGALGRIIPCRVDSRGFQSRRESRLRGLARRVAEEVARHGGSRTLRPMNPADRRIVHITVAEEPDVETESQGSGYFKRVSIRAV